MASRPSRPRCDRVRLTAAWTQGGSVSGGDHVTIEKQSSVRACVRPGGERLRRVGKCHRTLQSNAPPGTPPPLTMAHVRGMQGQRRLQTGNFPNPTGTGLTRRPVAASGQAFGLSVKNARILQWAERHCPDFRRCPMARSAPEVHATRRISGRRRRHGCAREHDDRRSRPCRHGQAGGRGGARIDRDRQARRPQKARDTPMSTE